MAKTNLALDTIVLLDNEELEAVMEYFEKDLDSKEKENSDEAREFYLNHQNE